MDFGILVRRWRAVRHVSQLDLALDAAISARHLSCIETGRAQPSREMVLRLARALQVPLSERNALLLAAGYAPLYRYTSRRAPELEAMCADMDFFLAQLEPNPVLILDRYWNILRMNDGAKRFFALFASCDAATLLNRSRLIFHPRGLRPFIENWELVAAQAIQRVQQEVVDNPSDLMLKRLLEELLSYPDVPSRWRRFDLERAPRPFLTINYRWNTSLLRLFSTLTTLGSSLDSPRQDVRIESLFPADERTSILLNPFAESCAGSPRVGRQSEIGIA
jgi:transcriptional regulator with XRE-family HTH domain